MKKLLAVIAGLIAGTAAYAGDYHIRETLRCSQCHTMHFSRAHGINSQAFPATGVGSDFLALTGFTGPNRNLLLQDGTNATCLACHDQSAVAPDVLGANFNDATIAAWTGRSAGALSSTGPAKDDGAGYEPFMGHTIGSDEIPPGWVGIYEPTPQENFNCANCHAVHGSAAFRNLGLSQDMGLPGWSGTPTNPFAAVGPEYNAVADIITGTGRSLVGAATEDVFVKVDARTYRTQDVIFKQGGGGMNEYCAVCHGNFHGDSNTRDLVGGVDFVRHPTSGVVRNSTFTAALADRTALVRPAWTTAGAQETGDFEAACLSCHKGHGNARGYALIYPSGVAPTTGEQWENGNAAQVDLGDGAQYPLRNMCITCHRQGRP